MNFKISLSVLQHLFFQYSSAGDDSVSETVTDLVRGSLCPALKNIFEHGMKRQSFLGGSYHPWHFIEEVAMSFSFHTMRS